MSLRSKAISPAWKLFLHSSLSLALAVTASACRSKLKGSVVSSEQSAGEEVASVDFSVFKVSAGTKDRANISVVLTGATGATEQHYQLSANGQCTDESWSAWTAFSEAFALKWPANLASVATLTVCVEVRAPSGETAVGQSVVTYATTPPNARLELVGKSPFAKRDIAAKVLAANGAVQYRIAVGGCERAKWVSADKNGIIAITLADKDGPQKLCGEARDAAQNVQKLSGWSVVLDRTLPQVSILTTGLQGGNIADGAMFAIAGTAVEPHSGLATMDISVRGSTGMCLDQGKQLFSVPCPQWFPMTAGTAWSFQIPEQAFVNDHYEIDVRAANKAGNMSVTTGTMTWYQPPPIAVLINLPASPSNITALNVEVGGIEVAAYDYAIGAASSLDCSQSNSYSGSFRAVTTPITDDFSGEGDIDMRLCVISRDVFGNTQHPAHATSVTWTKDTVPPGVFNLSAPSGFVNTASIVASWTASLDAARYNLHVSSVADCSDTVQGPHIVTDLSRVLNPLGEGLYHLCVTSRDAAGNETAAGNQALPFTVDRTAPSGHAITAPSVLVNSLTPVVSWTDAADEVAYELFVHAGVRRCDATASMSFEGLAADTLSQTLPGLIDGEHYHVCLAAIDAAGNSAVATYSFTVDVTAPSGHALTSPAAVINSTTPAVTWNDAADEARYDLYVHAGSLECGLGADIQFQGLAANTTSQSLSGLTDGTTYHICLIATDLAGNSSQVTTVFTVDTSAPSGHGLTGPVGPTNSDAPTVTWTDATGESRYDLYVNAGSLLCNATATFTFQNLPADTTSQALSGLSDGVTYHACLVASDVAGNSAATSANFLIDTVAPSGHAIISPTGYIGTSQPTVTWADAAGESQYNLYVSTAGQCDHTAEIDYEGLPANTVSQQIGGLTEGTTYRICLVAVDAVGNSSAVYGSFVIDLTPPNLQGILTPGSRTNATSLAVTWPDADGEDFYDLYVHAGSLRCDNTADIAFEDLASNTTSQLLSGLLDGQIYHICLVARDEAGNTAQTTSTVTIDTVAPSGHSIISPASFVTTNVTVVTWNDATDEHRYDLYVNAGSLDCTSSASQVYTELASGTVSQSLSGLSDGVTYYVCLVASDDVGNSSQETMNFTVDMTAPSGHVILSPANPTKSQVPIVSWLDADGESHYHLYVNAGSLECSSSASMVFENLSMDTMTQALSDTYDGFTYYVCLVAVDAAGNSSQEFHTFFVDRQAPAGHVITGPAALVGSSAPEITWNDADDEVAYHLYVHAGSSFCNDQADLAFENISAGVTSQGVSGLVEGVVYHVCLVADDALGNAAAVHHEFSVDLTPPHGHSITGPDSLTNHASPKVQWIDADGEDHYEIYVDPSSSHCSDSAAYFHKTISAGSTEHQLPFLGDGYYHVCLVALDAVGNASYTYSNFTLDTAPPAPIVITGPAAYVTSIATTVTWDLAPDAAKYDLYVNVGSLKCDIDADHSFVGILGSTASQTLIALNEGKDHYVCLVATDEAGNAASGSHVFHVDTIPPSGLALHAPSAYVTNNSTVISWDDAVGESRYHVYVHDGALRCDYEAQIFSENLPANTTTHSVANLGDGTTYYVCLIAEDAAGNTAQVSRSFTVDLTGPAGHALTGPSSLVNTLTPTVTWNDADDEVRYDLYLHEGESRCDHTAGIVIEDIEADATSQDVTGLADGKTYYVCLRATDVAGNRSDVGLSFTVDVTPPSGLSITAPGPYVNNVSTTIVWDDAAGETGYDLFVRPYTPSCDGSPEYSLGQDVTSQTVTSLGHGTSYYICLVARDDAGNTQVVTHSFMVDLVAPSGHIIIGPSDTIANDNPVVVWSGASGHSHYNLYVNGWSLECGENAEYKFENLGDDATSQALSGLSNENLYHICLVAVDEAGNVSTADASFFVDMTAPTGFDLTPIPAVVGTATLTISWDDAADESSYSLYINPDESQCSQGAAMSFEALPENTVSQVISGLQHDVTYHVCLIAVDGVGNSGSVSTTFLVDLSAPNQPGTPTTAGAYSGTSVMFSWSAVGDNGGAGLASYNVQVGTYPGGADIADENVGNVLSHSFTGDNGQTYYARVRAIDAVGNASQFSPNSAGVTVDTIDPAGASALRIAADDASGPHAAYDNDTTVFLVWTAGSDAQSGLDDYTVQWFNAASCAGGATSPVVAKNLTSYSLGVVHGNTYSFRIVTKDMAGNSVTSACSSSITIDTVAPPALAGFSGNTGSQAGRVELSIDFPADVTDYHVVRIYRSAPSNVIGVLPPNCGAGTLAATITAFIPDPMSYSDDTGHAGSYFSYRACAYDRAENVVSITASDIRAMTYSYRRYYDASDIDGNGSKNVGDISSSTSAVWADITGNGDATLTNFNFNTANSGWSGDGTPGNPYHLKFDGANDYASAGTFVAHAYAIWFKADVIDANPRVLFSTYNYQDLTYARLVNGSLYYQYPNGNFPNGMWGGVTVTPNDWHHFVLTFDGDTTCRAILNGEVIQIDETCRAEQSNLHYIGWDTSSSYPFDGSIGSIKFYSSGISAAEAHALYVQERTTYYLDPGDVAVDRVVRAFSLPEGGSDMKLYGWRFNDVTDVIVGGNSVPFSLSGNGILSLSTPSMSIGSHAIELVGGNGVTLSNAVHVMGGKTDSLNLFFDGRNVDTLGTSAMSVSSQNRWKSLANSTDALLKNFDFNTANSGWAGDGSPMDPYRLKFDGANDYAIIGSTVNRSYAVWFNADTVDANGRVIFGQYNFQHYTYALVRNNSLDYQYNFSTGMFGSVPIVPGGWNHLVMTFDGANTCYAYLNGLLIQTDITCSLETNYPHYLGWDSANSFFDGSIGSFKGYGSYLSQADVLAMYYEERPLYLQNPGEVRATRIIQGLSPASGGATVIVEGWNLDEVASVSVGGVPATFNLISSGRLEVSPQSLTLGWHNLTLSGGSGDSVAKAVLATNIPLTPMVLFLTGESIDGLGSAAVSSEIRPIWSSLSNKFDVSLYNFNFGTSGSGWDGDGTVGNPHRLKFDGSNDHVRIGRVVGQSYSVWFNADTIDANGRYIFASYSFQDYTYARVRNNLIEYQYGNSGGMFGSAAVSAGTWNHFVMTHESGNVCKAYLNGALIQTAGSCSIELNLPHFIGWNSASASYFDGSIGNYKLYSATLSQADVTAIYNEEKALYIP